MNSEKSFAREGYLDENYHFFHLRDTSGQEKDFHFHDFDKIVILISGRVEYTVESRTYELKPFDILLVKHHTIHRAAIDISQPYERVIIYLDRGFFRRSLPEARLMDCFERADETGKLLLEPDDAQKKTVLELINAYESNKGDLRYGDDAMGDTIIMQLLICLRRISASASREREHRYDPKIAEVLSYINEQLRADLSVENLAERVYLSKYHFMRLFKEQTGETVHAYIRQKRLLNAAKLIRAGMSAEHAASESGFGDYSTFHRAFRESFGTTPGMLKK